MSAVDALVDAVRAALASAADPERAEPMRRYMKSAMPFHGVGSDALRRAVRPLIAAHPLPDRVSWESAVRRLYDEAGHREERYAAIQVAGHRLYHSHRDPDALDLWRHLIVTGAWWDLVDSVVGLVDETLRAHPDAVRPVVVAWASDDDLWVRRAAIISQLRAKDATDEDLLTAVVDANLEGSRFGSEFFIRKAIGWALRQYARTDPDWVRAFVAERGDRLSGLTRREALKHLRA
ncbi:MAG: DNA alkylation repair protein [Propionibacteriaceae bacterium]|nr:DNA alkylation repair protein [Propionibacteriaceae bacterium]